MQSKRSLCIFPAKQLNLGFFTSSTKNFSVRDSNTFTIDWVGDSGSGGSCDGESGNGSGDRDQLRFLGIGRLGLLGTSESMLT